MRVIRIVFVTSLLLVGLFAGGHLTANAQSVEEAYDATLDAYNQTLNQLEECDLKFEEFQQLAKKARPAAGAPKADWDDWAKKYRFWVDVYKGCIGMLKREADNLKKKLEELQKQLDAAGSGTETKAPPEKDTDKKKKAPGLVKKGTEDLEKWTVGVRYKIQQVDGWSRSASEDVKEHGSGEVRIHPRFEYKF